MTDATRTLIVTCSQDAGTAIRTAVDSIPCSKMQMERKNADVLKQEALTAAATHRSDSVIGIDKLRSEGLADLFATNVLLQSTHAIMRAINSGPFLIQNFIAEMMIFLNIIVLIQQCRQLACIASQSSVDRALAHDLVRQPVAGHVRALMMSVFLQHLAAPFLFKTDNPTGEHVERTAKLINEGNEHLIKAVKDIDAGMARAMRFSLFPEERDDRLFEKFAHEIGREEIPASLLEARQFCALAKALDVHGHGLEALRETIAHA